MTIESVDFKLIEKSADRQKREGFLKVSPEILCVSLQVYFCVERFINFLVQAIDMKILASGERLHENSSVKM